MKFKIGDKVKNIKTGEIDTVVSVPGMKKYDKHGFIAAAEGFVLKNSAWEYQIDWELVSEEIEESSEKCINAKEEESSFVGELTIKELAEMQLKRIDYMKAKIQKEEEDIKDMVCHLYEKLTRLPLHMISDDYESEEKCRKY